MINAFFNALFNIIISVVNLLLLPIDNLINSTIPAFGDVLTSFANFLNYILGFIPWGLSWFHIPAAILSFLIYYIIAKITISASVHVVKIALAWWRTLLP